MDRYYIGFTMSDRKFQVFACSWSVERTMKESGYDLLAGPYTSKEEAEVEMSNLESWNLHVR